MHKIENTERFRTDLKQVFDCIRNSKDKERFQQYVLDTPELAQLDEDAYDVISRYTDILRREEVSIKNKIEGGKINMCKAVEELKADCRAEGRAELIVDLLKKIGEVSEALFQRILKERDGEVLCDWARLAVCAKTVQEFEEGINL